MTRSHDKSVQVNDALNRAGEIRGRLQLAEHATLAHRVAVSLLAAAYDDARAATLLIGNYGPDLVGSALSLVRPMNEKLRRGCWFFLGATEEQADQFLTHDRLPPSNVMVEAIEREEPFRSFLSFPCNTKTESTICIASHMGEIRLRCLTWSPARLVPHMQMAMFSMLLRASKQSGSLRSL